jgi:hypothetical protein
VNALHDVVVPEDAGRGVHEFGIGAAAGQRAVAEPLPLLLDRGGGDGGDELRGRRLDGGGDVGRARTPPEVLRQAQALVVRGERRGGQPLGGGDVGEADAAAFGGRGVGVAGVTAGAVVGHGRDATRHRDRCRRQRQRRGGDGEGSQEIGGDVGGVEREDLGDQQGEERVAGDGGGVLGNP